MEVTSCRCPGNICSENFPNSKGNYGVESIFSKVEEFYRFSEMNATNDIYLEFRKIF